LFVKVELFPLTKVGVWFCVQASGERQWFLNHHLPWSRVADHLENAFESDGEALKDVEVFGLHDTRFAHTTSGRGEGGRFGTTISSPSYYSFSVVVEYFFFPSTPSTMLLFRETIVRYEREYVFTGDVKKKSLSVNKTKKMGAKNSSLKTSVQSNTERLSSLQEEHRRISKEIDQIRSRKSDPRVEENARRGGENRRSIEANAARIDSNSKSVEDVRAAIRNMREEKKKESKEVASILGFLLSRKSGCEKERSRGAKEAVFRATQAV
jgi:hypothetical protein